MELSLLPFGYAAVLQGKCALAILFPILWDPELEANPCTHAWGIRLTQECVEPEPAPSAKDSSGLAASPAVLPLPLHPPMLPLCLMRPLRAGHAQLQSEDPPVYWNRKFQHRADFLDRDHRDTHACMGDPFAWPTMRVARLVDNGPQRNTWAPCNIKKEAGLESPQPQAHLEACAALTLGTRGLISRRSRLVLCPRRSCVAIEPLCVAV